MKRFLSAVFAALLMLSCTACGSSTSQADTDAVKAAVDKFRACSSFSMVQTTEQQEAGTMEGLDYSYSSSTRMELILIAEPSLQMMTSTTAKLDYDGEKMEQTMSSYVVPENGGYAEYYYDGAEWFKVSSDDASALTGFSAAAVADAFFTDIIAFGKVGEESMDGLKASRYEGKLGGEDLVGMLEVNGQLSSISSMSQNQQEIIKKNLVKDLDPVTVRVWIDESSGYPIRFELDMSGLFMGMDKSISKSLGEKTSSSQRSLNEYVVSMIPADFNAVDKIELPAEAANARPYEDIAE